MRVPFLPDDSMASVKRRVSAPIKCGSSRVLFIGSAPPRRRPPRHFTFADFFLFIGKVGALINARALKIAMTCVDERATLIIAD